MGEVRRRGAELERALLDAAAAVLVEDGYPAFTMDRVAARAGTNKNALYRRWPHRAALAVAAYRHLGAAEIDPPDLGDLRSDVLETLRRINTADSGPHAAALRSLRAAVSDDPELASQLHGFADDTTRSLALAVVHRAVERGEVGPGARHPRVATLAITLLRHEYLVTGTSTLPDGILVEIVDEVYLPLVRAGGPHEQRPDS